MLKIKILLVDDEEDILELLQYNLEKADFKVLRASNGEEALEIACKEEPDMILLARLQAIIRRGRQSGPAPVEQSNTLKVGELEINRDEYLVYRKGKPLSLPKKEFELLLFLASQPGKVFTRDILLEQVWGSDVQVVDRTIDVHVRKLREKIGKKWIKTIQGVGYKFTTKA